MIIYNASSSPFVVRGFAEMVNADISAIKIVMPQEKEFVFGPPLPHYGFASPYLLVGELLVRDVQGINFPTAVNAPVMTLEAGKRGTFHRPFYCDPKFREGVFIAFFNESELVGL